LKVILAILLSAGAALGQTHPASAADSRVTTVTDDAAVVVFSYENSQRDLARYTISVDDAGNARYIRDAAINESEVEQVEFQVSCPVRDRIFELARSAHFFNDQFEFTKHRIAYTGDRTFQYRDGEREHSARVKATVHPAINELSRIFEGIQNSLIADAKLRHLHRYEKLGLNAYLGSLEREAKSGWLVEMRLMAETLRQLGNDRTVMEIARQRAQRLLARAEEESKNAIKPSR
jgi:hypothetical protein